jgi:hypothetical protein
VSALAGAVLDHSLRQRGWLGDHGDRPGQPLLLQARHPRSLIKSLLPAGSDRDVPIVREAPVFSVLISLLNITVQVVALREGLGVILGSVALSHLRS